MMTTNNEYYKTILEVLTEESVTGTHTDNYYLKRICEHYGHSYTENKCNGKYLKDFAESECQTTFTGHNFNNFYLHRIAEKVTNQDLPNNFDNYFLGLIAENISPSAAEFDSVSLTVANSILSYADGDNTTLTAQLTYEGEDAHLSGKSVSFDIVDGQGTIISNIGSDDTDSDGIATVTYTATGVGDLTIQASVMNGSDTYTDTEEVQDCMYWNSGASVGSLIYDTGATCTSNGEYISFGTSTSGEKYCKIPVTVENGSNWELEYTVAKLGTAQTSAFAVMYGTNDYVLCRPRDGKISVDGTKIGNNGYSRDFQANDVINWKYLNGTLTVTLNGTVTLYNGVTAISDITALRWYTNQNRMQHFKNIKVKPL